MRLRVLQSSPGFGRSEYILREIYSRLRAEEVSADSVMVLTPTRTEARLLATRFDRLALEAGRWFAVTFDTLQGIARELLDKHPDFAYHRPMDDMEERLVLESLLVSVLSPETEENPDIRAGAKVYAEAVRARNQGFIEDVHAFVAELKHHRIAPGPDHPGSAATYDKFISSLPQQCELQALGKVYEKYQDLLRKEQRYDAQGLLWNAYVAADNCSLHGSIRSYRLVYYDDAQDMSALEAELLARIVRPHTELVLTYCPNTAVFRFRYALQDPVASLSSLLSQAQDQPCEIVTEDLSRRSRCASGRSTAPEEQTDGTEPGRSRVQKIHPRPISRLAVKQNEENREDLTTQLWACPDVRLEREAVAAEIVSLMEGKDGEQPRSPEEIAIITRTHTEALEFSVVLFQLGVPVATSHGGPGTFGALLFLDTLLSFLESGLKLLSTGRASREFEQSLLTLASLRTDGASAVTRMMELAEKLREENIPLAEPAPGKNELVFAAGLAGRSKHLEHLNEALRACQEGQPTAAVLARLLTRFRVDRFLAEPDLSSAMRAVGSALRRISMAEQAAHRLGGRIDPAIIRRRLRYLVGRETDPNLQSGVSVLPAHETRGLQWSIVFVPRLNEHVFPADVHISALFRAETAQALKHRAESLAERRGLGRGAFSFVGFAEDPPDARQEEDHLFTLAVTRATQRLILSWSEQDGDHPVSPSVYVRAAVARYIGQPIREIDWSKVSTMFRHTVPREAYWYPPTRERIEQPVSSKTPVFDSVTVLHNPHSLSTCWLCPRRFFYAHALRLDRAVTDAQTYGTLVHAVLRSLALDPPKQERADLILRSPAIQQIIQDHRPRFSNESEFAFAIDRFRSALEDFLGKNPAFFSEPFLTIEGEPVIERRIQRGVTCEGKEIELVGLVDAAKCDKEGRIKIIDFKTGTPIGSSKLRKSMVHRDEDTGRSLPVDRDYQLPIYWFLVGPGKPAWLSHFYLRPAYAGREGFREATVLVNGYLEEAKEAVTREELDGTLREAFGLASGILEAKNFPREPRNHACSRTNCPFLFLCDGMEGE